MNDIEQVKKLLAKIERLDMRHNEVEWREIALIALQRYIMAREACGEWEKDLPVAYQIDDFLDEVSDDICL